jgi:arginine deiminase
LVDFTMPLPRSAVPYTVAPTLEGGDVLVFHEGVVLIGLSERTMEPAADRLVAALREQGQFRAVVLVNMPATRNAMHLDTIFTRASKDECLVYAPMICEGSPETVSAVAIDLQDDHHHGVRFPSLLSALRALGVDLNPLYCGGRTSYVQQAREQWTDGANCFALRPGVVLLYERNRATARELADHGYEVVEVSKLPFDEDGTCLRSFSPRQKYALLLEGHELSRARGGPRCMTMPLRRGPLLSTG